MFRTTLLAAAALALPSPAGAGDLSLDFSAQVISEAGTAPTHLAHIGLGDFTLLKLRLFEPAVQAQPNAWEYAVDAGASSVHSEGYAIHGGAPLTPLRIENDAQSTSQDLVSISGVIFVQNAGVSPPTTTSTFRLELAGPTSWFSSPDLRTMIGSTIDPTAVSTANLIVEDLAAGYSMTARITWIQIGEFSAPPILGGYCYGDTTTGLNGELAPCPCGNQSAPGAGEGCANSEGHGAIMAMTGSSNFAANNLGFTMTQARPLQPAMLVQGSKSMRVPFKDGLLCVGFPTARVEVIHLNAQGAGRTTGSVISNGNVTGPGSYRTYQFWYRDPGNLPCGSHSNFSNAFAVQFQ